MLLLKDLYLLSKKEDYIMKLFTAQARKLTKLLFLCTVLSLTLYGCSLSTPSLESTNATTKTYDYTLPSDNNSSNIRYGSSGLLSPLVTNSIPDEYLYPLSYHNFGSYVYMVNNNLYFESNGSLYEACSNTQGTWDTAALGIEKIDDLISDGTYLYCLTNHNIGVIYNPMTHSILYKIDFSNFFDSSNYNYELNCVGNEKAYFSFFTTDHAHKIFSLDQYGNIEVLKTNDDSYVNRVVYSDSEYLVYTANTPEYTDPHVYVENVQTGNTNQICDQEIINMIERNAPFYRWNDSFVFIISGQGICVSDADGTNSHLYTGNSTGNGYALYGNKLYFEGTQLVSFDLVTGEQETFDFGDEADFNGSINVCNGNILLARYEALSEYLTIHVIPLP